MAMLVLSAELLLSGLLLVAVLQSLKMKAGLSPDYFSETFEAYRFETEYIEEN